MNGEMSYKEGKYMNLIERFSDSGHKICEIVFTYEDRNGKSDETIVHCINQAAKRFSKPHIRAIRKDNKIFLINTI